MSARKNTALPLILHEIIIFTPATVPLSSVIFFLTTAKCTTIFTLLALLLLVPPAITCPPSCECKNTSILEVSCKNGRLLNIFTQIDSTVYSLSLDHVVHLKLISETVMQDLAASDIVILKITASYIQEIKENAFLKLPHLEEIDLSINELSVIYANSFAGLNNLKTLNLSHNQLSSLGQSLAILPNLVTLDLSANYLKDFLPGMLSSQYTLRFLKLNGNPLRNLQGNAFQGLHSMRELSARNCSLTHVENEVFSAMPSLVVIDLGQNRLNSIPSSSVLSKLINLRNLFMDSNEIQVLHPLTFEDVHLKTLDLSFNQISKIDSLVFERAIFSNLTLSFNLIISLNHSVLKPLGKHLTQLNIAGNPLRQLQKDVFEGLELLQTLNMSSCSLEAIEQDHLKSLPVLHRLDISHNNLPSLQQPILDIIDQLGTVSLHANTWICDCHIKSLRDWLTLASSASKVQCPSGQDRQTNCTNLRCTLPPDLQNSQIILLKDQELTCQHKKSSVLPAGTQGVIVASCLGFAIVLLIITIFLWQRGKTHKGLRGMCITSEAESSHVVDEDSKIPPLANCDRYSLTLSDHNFVFRHYFDHLVTDPKLIAHERGENEDGDDEIEHKEEDSLYSSQPSLYSHHSDAGYGMESTV